MKVWVVTTAFEIGGFHIRVFSTYKKASDYYDNCAHKTVTHIREITLDDEAKIEL
jgi:hypothetical protein